MKLFDIERVGFRTRGFYVMVNFGYVNWLMEEMQSMIVLGSN